MTRLVFILILIHFTIGDYVDHCGYTGGEMCAEVPFQWETLPDESFTTANTIIPFPFPVNIFGANYLQDSVWAVTYYCQFYTYDNTFYLYFELCQNSLVDNQYTWDLFLIRKLAYLLEMEFSAPLQIASW